MKLNNSVDEFYLFLAGGVGAAKLLDGFNQIINQSKLKIIVNTGDDIELFGLKICPDLDIITYTLANKVDKKKGWGFKNDSFNCLEILKKYYETGWFNAGDKDLATHIYRTDLFSKGFKKSEITQKICKSLGVSAHILPMCDESVETYIKTSEGNIHFEEYYIKERCEPEILDVFFKGIEKAKPLKITLKLIENAKKIIICPSNPIVSIGTILSIQEIWNMLKEVKKKVYGVSPIIKGATVKGPADKFMEYYGLEVSSLGVAEFYREIMGTLIIDEKDHHLKKSVEKLGIKVYCYDTLMSNLEKKKNLAKFLLEI